MSKILITGAGGLVGTHLLPLLEKEFEVITISHSGKGKNGLRIDFSKEWDISELPENIDTIIHLAQSRSFREFPAKAADVFYCNTVSTLKLIDFAQKSGVKKFIYASSGGVYGAGDKIFKEDDMPANADKLGFYLTSKYSSELILNNYTDLLDIIQLRLFFVYGQGQEPDMLIPRLAGFVRSGKPITLQGSGGIRINPIHAGDAARAIRNAIDLKGSHKINVAGPEVVSIKEIGTYLGSLIGQEPLFNYEEKPTNHVVADIEKMKEMLYAPTVTVKDGLKTVI